MTTTYQLTRQQWVPAPRDDVFEFFSQASNLELLTPPWLGFAILTPAPIVMKAGTTIDYTIRLAGFPMKWRTLIDAWNPPFHFTDVQERGPYALWRHTHRFEEVGDGTLFTDTVDYRLPFGPIGRLIHTLSVRSTIGSIFDYRYAQIRARFGDSSGPHADIGDDRRHVG